ncbi:MAG: LamG-like jellyroll fold domain-containing protein [Planctomycetota bacterium]
MKRASTKEHVDDRNVEGIYAAGKKALKGVLMNMMGILSKLLLWVTFALVVCPSPVLADELTTYELKLAAPITTWDEAIPLGNGMLGGLLWGQGNTINLSLDRGDLWDETTQPEILEGDWTFANMQKLINENWGEFMRRYSHSYNHPAPTKLPGGRLVLTLSDEKKAGNFSLNMKNAIATANFTDGSKLDCFFCAEQRVALIRIDGSDVTSKFIRPGGIDRLNYKPAEFGSKDGMNWMLQEASEGLVYATLTASKRIGKQTLIAVAITTNREDVNEPNPLALAKSRVSKALGTGFEKMFDSHKKWWDDFWAVSEVNVPDERIQRHYNLVKYYYGAASRPDAPSMPLQAVWTQDSGGLPPWKGDFHHDLNTQMTYLAYHKAGLTDAGMSFINHMWDLLPEYRKFAKDFFGVEGAAIPTVMSLNGKPLGGWPQYSLSSSYSIWVGQSFYLHWKHTMDEKFLREKAYPWMDEIVSTIVKLLAEKDGKLYFQLSSSAEIFDASPRAYLKPNSNQDLSMLHWAFEAMAEMADALDKQDDVEKWNALRGQLNDLHVDDNNVLMFSSNEPFNQSHRHHAHTMAIHPFGTLNIDGTDEDRRIIEATLEEMDKLGTQAWTGYSFSWFASMLARAGQPELAYQYLTYYERAFILRNGFHVNGDQIGAGLSGFRYRPFTLEGNFLAMEAVHDMILQSWPVNIAEDPTPVIRLFPAMPWKWHNADFRDIRAEGGFIVSAERKNNATTRFKITAMTDGVLRLRDNFGGAKPEFNRKTKKVGSDFIIKLKAGQTLTGKLAEIDKIPPQTKASIEAGKRIRRVEDIAASKKYKISSAKIPLRIGADSNGQNRFVGDIARISVYDRVLTAGEIAVLAVKDGQSPQAMKGCVVSYDFSDKRSGAYVSGGSKKFPVSVNGNPAEIDAPKGLGKALRLDGDSFLETAHDKSLNCNKAVTLEAWICPKQLGGRVIDKSVAGSSQGYNMDTYAGSVRLVSKADTSNPRSKQKLPLNEWIHVAGTIDGETGDTTIYIDGKKVETK